MRSRSACDPSGSVAILGLFLVLACSSREPGLSPSPATPTATPTVHEAALSPEAPRTAPFSGEIVYRRSAMPNGADAKAIPMLDLHYFVSGQHWKQVDGAGDLVSVYDPDANVVHYFKPERSSVDASVSEGSATFEHLTETKRVLGRGCKGIRQTSERATFVAFYDPALFVDPKLYARHKLGNWDEFLVQTAGGLALFSSVELPEGDIVSEAIRIESQSFEPAFWSLPVAEP